MFSKLDSIIANSLSGAVNKFLVSLSATGVIGAVTHDLIPTLVSGLGSALVYLVSNATASKSTPPQ